MEIGSCELPGPCRCFVIIVYTVKISPPSRIFYGRNIRHGPKQFIGNKKLSGPGNDVVLIFNYMCSMPCFAVALIVAWPPPQEISPDIRYENGQFIIIWRNL